MKRGSIYSESDPKSTMNLSGDKRQKSQKLDSFKEIQIHLDGVPNFLRGGDLYKQFTTNHEESEEQRVEHTISLPEDCYIQQEKPPMFTEFDFIVLLKSLRFWLVSNNMPKELDTQLAMLLVYQTKQRDYLQKVLYDHSDFQRDLPYLQDIQIILSFRNSELYHTLLFIWALCGTDSLCICIQQLIIQDKSRSLDLYKHMYDYYHVYMLESWNELFSFTKNCQHTIFASASVAAAGCGNLECLKFLLDQSNPFRSESIGNDGSVCKAAAETGSLKCLKCAHEHDCPWDEETCTAAAGNGSLECLKYAHEHDCPWDKETCLGAAMSGHLECLKYAHEHGCPWDVTTCKIAAGNGSLECLKYAHEHGCEWDVEACINATKYAMKNKMECIKYLHEHENLLFCFHLFE